MKADMPDVLTGKRSGCAGLSLAQRRASYRLIDAVNSGRGSLTVASPASNSSAA